MKCSINVFENEAKDDSDIKGVLTFLVKTLGFLVKTLLHISPKIPSGSKFAEKTQFWTGKGSLMVLEFLKMLKKPIIELFMPVDK